MIHPKRYFCVGRSKWVVEMQGTNVCSLYDSKIIIIWIKICWSPPPNCNVWYDTRMSSISYSIISYSNSHQSINQPTNRTQAPINHSLSSVSLGIKSDPLNHLQIFRHHLLDQILETGLGSPSKLLLGLGRIPQQQLDLGGTEIPLINLD